jgi:Leucine-rich repeat (LRR) protein
MIGNNIRYKSTSYVDTQTEETCYDSKEQYLDLGYMRLGQWVPDAAYQNIRTLIINHNSLKNLPNNLPELRILDCSHNNLVSIPQYPKLRELMVRDNNIIDISAYHNSKQYQH